MASRKFGMPEMETLTPRQEQIARAIALGATKKEIAYKLDISEETVSNHAKQVYEKTGSRSVGQLSTWWFKKTFNILSELDPFAAVVAFFFLLLAVGNEFNVDDSHAIRTVRAKVKVKKGRRNDQDDSPCQFLS